MTKITWCAYCRCQGPHAPWCPIVVVTADAQRPAGGGVATEDWARGLLAALGVTATDAAVTLARDALVALHRHANVEGFGDARERVCGAELSDDITQALAARHDELHAVGVERPPAAPTPQKTARRRRASAP